jgi:hypothetical protein
LALRALRDSNLGKRAKRHKQNNNFHFSLQKENLSPNRTTILPSGVDSLGRKMTAGEECKLAGESWIPAGGEQEKHCMVALEFGRYLLALKAVRHHYTVESDLPFPLRGMVGHRDLKHA